MNIFELAKWDILSPEALGIATWIVAQGPMYEFRIDDARRAFGIGEHKWSRISRELRAAGVISHRIAKVHAVNLERHVNIDNH